MAAFLSAFDQASQGIHESLLIRGVGDAAIASRRLRQGWIVVVVSGSRREFQELRHRLLCCHSLAFPDDSSERMPAGPRLR